MTPQTGDGLQLGAIAGRQRGHPPRSAASRRSPHPATAEATAERDAVDFRTDSTIAVAVVGRFRRVDPTTSTRPAVGARLRSFYEGLYAREEPRQEYTSLIRS
ncbi:hypothetical protein IMZ48_44350, partial [Candidatus Bathyarchaeota archaeon]|nr:hypothetical protein [Candidatus Bathyarchaeota archaeon]